MLCVNIISLRTALTFWLLDVQWATWISPVYAHFKMPPEILVDADGDVFYIFVCACPGGFVLSQSLMFIFLLNRCAFFRKLYGKLPLTRARNNPSTSNLSRHITRCLGLRTSVEFPVMPYSDEALRYTMCEWVSESGHPYSIVRNPKFRE